MSKLWTFSRRRFVQFFTLLPFFSWARSSGPAPGFKLLTRRESELLEAIAEVMIPEDEDPGARQAGVAHYIDGVLYEQQRERYPLYLAGLGGIVETAASRYNRDFLELDRERQTELLRSVESGDVEGVHWERHPPEEFFHVLWLHVMEGFYGPPEHGGNKGAASYHMVGFPNH